MPWVTNKKILILKLSKRQLKNKYATLPFSQLSNVVKTADSFVNKLNGDNISAIIYFRLHNIQEIHDYLTAFSN